MLLRLEDGSTIQVKFTHYKDARFRRRTEVDGTFSQLLHDGYGATKFSEETIALWGEAFCNDRDPYCKAIGRKIALQRAISFLSRGRRAQIWKAYFEYIGASQRQRSKQ